MGRAPCCEKVGLKKGRWTAEEDEILTKYIQASGEGSWRTLPKNAGLLRCGKSCRLRWINYLRADLKRGNISAEEEDTIIKLHNSFGNRWSLIASQLPGRTDNEIKNYWNSHLSRKIYSFRGPASKETALDTPKLSIPPKRKGGRTSRWAMKKNKSYPQREPQRPKQSVTHHHQNNKAAVPVPPTSSLESEGLSTAIVDFMVLDPDKEHMAGRAEIANEPIQETREGNEDCLLSCGGSDGEGLQEVQVQVQCPAEEASTDENSILCFGGEKEGNVINGGGALSYGGIMDTSSLLEHGGALMLNEGRESNDAVGVGEENERRDTCPHKMATSEDPESSVNLSSNGESGEWYSCSSMGVDLELDDKWDWESVVELNHNNECEAWERKEHLLTWLWEDDDWESDCQKSGEIDPEEQNAMVAWFLSSG